MTRSPLAIIHSVMRGMLTCWPGRNLLLRPLRDLEPAEGKHAWRSLGARSCLACEGKGFPLPAGWYLLSMNLQSTREDHCLAPTLHLNYDQRTGEQLTLPVPMGQTARTKSRTLIRLPLTVHRLRLDTGPTACTFTLGSMRLRRLQKLEVAWRMWRAVRRRTSKPHVLRTRLWRYLKGSTSRQQFAHWLYSQYTQCNAHEMTYARWLERHDPGKVQPRRIDRPLVSIVLPTCNTPETLLRRCLDSVLAQTWENWELCIADDASSDPRVRDVLQEYASRDGRIHVTWRPHNGHISAASNSALELATGEYVALLDHDDELHPAALTLVMDAWAQHPQWRMVYTDEDKIDEMGNRYDPHFKPEWNEELLLGHNFICHLVIYQRSLVSEVGSLVEGLEGAQDWDLVLRCSRHLEPAQIGHIPAVLYHWRAVDGSTALCAQQHKGYTHAAARRALQAHLDRCGEHAEVLDIGHARGCFHIRRALPDVVPAVSIIVPTRDQAPLLRQCVDSILQRSTYPNYEIVLADNQSSETDALKTLQAYARHPRIRVLRHDAPFNFSIINNEAVASCDGELVCLLNNDTEIITPAWLEELVGHALRPHVGAVGAMLYYPNDTIQHAGVIIGHGGVAAHAYGGKPRGYPGYMGRARLAQAMGAVTGACLMVRRQSYHQVGGLDKNLRVAFGDIDFCLRLRERGYTNVWTPFAELYHHESISRGYEDTPEKKRRFATEATCMLERWGDTLKFDPAYSPNFALTGEPFTLAFPPRPWCQETTMELTGHGTDWKVTSAGR